MNTISMFMCIWVTFKVCDFPSHVVQQTLTLIDLDHILTLQQSLAHYERVLSTSQPTYLSHLRVSLSQAQSGTDTALVTLTAVSMGVLLVQTLIGECARSDSKRYRLTLPCT